MPKQNFSEVELAEKFVKEFENRGFDVYQEVKVCGGCADIIAVVDGLVTIVEVKRSLTISLLDQAYSWVKYANFVYIAVPHSRERSRYFAFRICRNFGFGVLTINKNEIIKEVETPRRQRETKADRILKALRPEHKTYCKAGSRFGKRFTPFTETCGLLVKYVNENPGVLLINAIKSIKHHYSSNSSAKFSLNYYIKKGVIKGIRIYDGKLYIDKSNE